jgi:hypothetical protein
MIRNREVSLTARWLGVGLLGLLPLVSGCDEKKDTNVQAPPQPAEEQKREQEARAKAYGPNSMPPPKGGASAAKPAEKPAEKSAEKSAEKPASK